MKLPGVILTLSVVFCARNLGLAEIPVVATTKLCGPTVLVSAEKFDKPEAFASKREELQRITVEMGGDRMFAGIDGQMMEGTRERFQDRKGGDVQERQLCSPAPKAWSDKSNPPLDAVGKHQPAPLVSWKIRSRCSSNPINL